MKPLEKFLFFSVTSKKFPDILFLDAEEHAQKRERTVNVKNIYMYLYSIGFENEMLKM